MVINIEDKEFVNIKNQNLNRWLVGYRNYFYVYRYREGNEYICAYRNSKLLNELLEIYNSLSKEERTTYVNKTTQKAE